MKKLVSFKKMNKRKLEALPSIIDTKRLKKSNLNKSDYIVIISYIYYQFEAEIDKIGDSNLDSVEGIIYLMNQMI